MHAIEKLLAVKAGVDRVHAGQIVNCDVDVAGINDLYYQTVKSFYEMGGKKVKHPDDVQIFFDHYAPCATVIQAEDHKKFRAFAHEQGIANLMDVNQGVCHQVVVDRGLAKPGEIVVITDSHSTMHGALGAFGTGVGATDLATILITGKLWFKVPEVIRINLTGRLQPGVYAKDVILHILGDLKADHGIYKAIEFAGPALTDFTISERLALCNMTTEMGAATSYIQPDDRTRAFLKSKGVTDYPVYTTDADYQYEEDLTYDISQIEPQVAAPADVDNVHDLSNYQGIHVDQAYIGSCTGGRLQDFAIAAKILKGHHIAPDTRLIIVPASGEVTRECIARGYIQDLLDAGATLSPSGCAACIGIHQGLIAADEVCMSTSNRNFPGRMGSLKGQIYLASPAATATAALTGQITDPRDYVEA
ncbi:3-isopropylmalate dehydratase large subunit [Levilactobacillus acidifarinae]|nr:3-isopropylmalate dehydratase large subunit [Levilactobacillus acidifarinae]GEO69078.1 3-isopropylmalate dehydratase large subunit [Levilactobacillus acidifarinae]